MDYTIPVGCHAISKDLLDLRPDAEIDDDLLHPAAVSGEKNIWFYWHSGYANMHPYTQRNVRAWHRRLSRLGWVIRVLDRAPSSPLHVANFLDATDPTIFPKAFIDDTLTGTYAVQHSSDLVRWPLLLKYGGVYADAGLMQIGDVDRLWNETIANPASRYEVLSYNSGGVEARHLMNYFLVSRRGNPFFLRCHQLFLKLWEGKTSTEGMHRDALLAGVPLLGKDDNFEFEENGRKYGSDEVSRMLSDYITQGQAMSMVMGLVDEEGGWNGPKYVAEHIFAIDYMNASQLINVFTAWDGNRAFELMSLPLPKGGRAETVDEAQAREIVEACLARSFGFKLATGLILRVIGETLSSLWRKHDGSDDVPGTYAHWLRYGTMHWTQDDLPSALDFEIIAPFKVGPLLRVE